MLDFVITAADRLGTIEPILQYAVIALGVAACLAHLAAGLLLGVLWSWAVHR